MLLCGLTACGFNSNISSFIFSESAPWPIQSISRNVRLIWDVGCPLPCNLFDGLLQGTLLSAYECNICTLCKINQKHFVNNEYVTFASKSSSYFMENLY